MKFRKRPIVIEASQWWQNGDHPLDYSKTHDGLEDGCLRQFPPDERKATGWEGDVVRYFRHPDKAGERSGVLLTAEFISRQRSGLSAAMICYAAMEK